MKKSLSFEQKLSQIEKLAAELEQGDLPFDEALSHYKNGLNLITECKEYLKSTKSELDRLQQHYAKEAFTTTDNENIKTN